MFLSSKTNSATYILGVFKLFFATHPHCGWVLPYSFYGYLSHPTIRGVFASLGQHHHHYQYRKEYVNIEGIQENVSFYVFEKLI